MAKAEGIPPTASVASVGPGIRYLGQHIYAYSGIKAVGSAGQDVPSTLLEFTTGDGYMVVTLHAMRGYTSNEGHNYLWVVKLNGQTVFEFFDSNADFNEYPITLIIPPWTIVQVTTQNSSAGTDNNVGFSITGRVYDV